MDKFIYVNKDSISRELCKDIIDMFEMENDRYPGIVGNGYLNKNVKDTTDFVMTSGGSHWDRINETLIRELTANVTEYIKRCNSMVNDNYKTFYTGMLSTTSLQIQKYIQNIGKFTYHEDSRVDFVNKSVRKITFLWYLNDVTDGGETEFWSDYKITPEFGKLILFPAEWSFPHTGKIPISNDKYIITGWLWENES